MHATTFEKDIIYQSPAIYVIDVIPEGILCASGQEGTEGLNKSFGRW